MDVDLGGWHGLVPTKSVTPTNHGIEFHLREGRRHCRPSAPPSTEDVPQTARDKSVIIRVGRFRTAEKCVRCLQ